MPDFLRDMGNLRHMTIHAHSDIRSLEAREVGQTSNGERQHQ